MNKGTNNAASPQTKKAARTVGARAKHVSSPSRKVSKAVRPTHQTYPSKRLLAIMDPEERSRYIGK